MVYRKKKKVCELCKKKVKHIDYKDIALLKNYLTKKWKIMPRRKTGNCAQHQHMVARAIKKARFMALIPYVPDHSLLNEE
jgi:small subunit ribosomal protein S18